MIIAFICYLQMNKQVLREVYLEKRKTLTKEEHSLRSLDVTKRTIAYLKESSARNVHLFLPITKQRELDTWPILNFLIDSARFQPIVSTTIFEQKEMKHFLVDKNTNFAKDKYGIPSPVDAKPFQTEEIDIVFTPLISFDKVGNRIGYGGGFYDRFLAKCKSNTEIIGLAITPPLDFIPYAEHQDISLTGCINHHLTFDFS